MEMATDEVGDSGSECGANNGTLHIGDNMSYDPENGSILEHEESTFYEGDLVSATVVGYCYRLRTLGSVVPEVMAGCRDNSSLDSGNRKG
eukprot:7683515-Ditylum_brightwellii.AAC.1